MGFKISWDKAFSDNSYFTRYTPVITKDNKYNGFYLSGLCNDKGFYKVEAQPNGIHGHLYPKVLIEEGSVGSLSKAKNKVREIFIKYTDQYDKEALNE